MKTASIHSPPQSRQKQPWDLRLNRLPPYLAAGVGMAGVASSVEAQIIPINIGSFTSGSFNLGSVNAGLSPGGNASFNNFPMSGPSIGALRDAAYSGVFVTGLFGNPSQGLEFATGGGYVNPMDLALNAVINASTPTGSWSSLRIETGFQYTGLGIATAPDFGPGSYMGFRFGTAGSYNYGWLEVTWDSTFVQFQVLSGAYQSTINTAILAGDLGSTPVPESTPGGLMGVLLGGAALRQWRKSRREAAAATETVFEA